MWRQSDVIPSFYGSVVEELLCVRVRLQSEEFICCRIEATVFLMQSAFFN